jgi:hypothetical protein
LEEEEDQLEGGRRTREDNAWVNVIKVHYYIYENVTHYFVQLIYTNNPPIAFV